MPLDPETAALLEEQRALPPRNSLTVHETRERMRSSAQALGGTPPELLQVEDMAAGELRTRLYTPSRTAAGPVVVFFHGGRFFSGDLETHDILCRHLAQASDCRVLAVDYRLAPEHRFPAAAEDACSATGWALRQFGSVVVAGDSAGANLAAVAALEHRSALTGQVLVYPMLDAQCSSASYREFAEGFGPGAVDMQRGWDEYLPAGTDRSDYRVSPVYARDLRKLPPALILTAEYDTLRDEAEAFASNLSAAGITVIRKRYAGTIHGFLQMTGRLRAAHKAIIEIAGFLRPLAPGSNPLSSEWGV